MITSLRIPGGGENFPLSKLSPSKLSPGNFSPPLYPRVQVNGKVVCVACALCVSVFHAAECGNGETWRPPTRPWLLAQELTRDSLPLCLLV